VCGRTGLGGGGVEGREDDPQVMCGVDHAVSIAICPSLMHSHDDRKMSPPSLEQSGNA
jgi:hypothetical protein